MGIFDFLLKRIQQNDISSENLSVSNDQLIPFLTKEWMEAFERIFDETDSEYFSFEEWVPHGENSEETVSYSTIPSLCYFDPETDSIYGFIEIMNSHRGSPWITYLVNFDARQRGVRALFEFEHDYKTIVRTKFRPNEIIYPGAGLTRICASIEKYARLNAYSNAPPYVFFAKMINL